MTGYSSDSDSDQATVENTAKSVSNVLPNVSSPAVIKSLSGKYQEEILNPIQFQRKKRLYDRDGIGNINSLSESKKTKCFDSTKTTKAKVKEYKKKKKSNKSKGDLTQLDDEENAYKGSWASDTDSDNGVDNIPEEPNDEAKIEYVNTNVEFKETSRYYGSKSNEYSIFDLPNDYQIRFATTIAGQKEYFVPKKQTASFKGHESAVTSLEFFPNSGHMMLSSGNDGMVKLWSTTRPNFLIRDYHSDTKSVKYSTFSSDGKEFACCSYDRTVRIWDTENGEVSFKYKLKANPNMCKFVPNQENEIMVALSSHNVEHIDSRSNEIIQVYDHHQSPVTWIEFLNDGNQFITASDDRTLKIWDIRINMPIKYIQDPKQQAMPIVKKHPNNKYFVGQSMDNQILVYSAKQTEKFKKINTKLFSGHNCAAYAIQMGFTPDGKTIFSGDSTGYCYFWDWKTSKIVRKIKVCNEVISCIDVHPLESSLYTMAGHDGNIYMYS